MDIVAHGLWVGVALVAARRRRHVPASTAALTIAMAVAPDIVQLLPLLAIVFEPGGAHVLNAYVTALPGAEPQLPPATWTFVHHLHCAMHSAVVAGVVSAAVWVWRQALWLPLLGWWSHIVVDVFTHSAEFYPSPVLYPFTDRGFDGIAWNTPWFMAVNYAALAVAFGLLLASRRRAVDSPR